MRLERRWTPWRHAHLHLCLWLWLWLLLLLRLYSHGRLVLLDRFKEVDEVGIGTLDGLWLGRRWWWLRCVCARGRFRKLNPDRLRGP